MSNQIQSDVKNACLFISEVIENQILPFFNGNNTYSANDLSAVLSQFLIVQNALLAYNQSLDSVLTEVETKIQNFSSNTTPSLLFEYVVSANCTSVDIPNLDIVAHKSYRVEIDILNATPTAFSLGCYVNGNITKTNYTRQIFGGDGTNYSARGNETRCMDCSASVYSSAVINISLVNNRVHINSLCSVMNSLTVLASFVYSTMTLFAVSNLTQLSFISTLANSIGIGSKIRIYRGDA